MKKAIALLILIPALMASQVNVKIIMPKQYLNELSDVRVLVTKLWDTPLACATLSAYRGEMLRGVLAQFNRTIVHDYLKFTDTMMKVYNLMSAKILPPAMQVAQAKMLLGAAKAYLRTIQADVAALENVTQNFNFPDCKSKITDGRALLRIANVTMLSPEEAVKIVTELKLNGNPAECYFEMKLHEVLVGLKKWISVKKMQLKELETRLGLYNRVMDSIIASMYGEKAATVLQSLSDGLKIYTIATILNNSIPLLDTPTGDIFTRSYTVGQNLYKVTRYGFIINVASPYASVVSVPKECRGVLKTMRKFLLTLNLDQVVSKYGGINKLASCFSTVLKSSLNISMHIYTISFSGLTKQVHSQEASLQQAVQAYRTLICG